MVAVAWGVGPGSGGAGSERGREPPCPELHREKSLEKAADSGRSEGGRNEGAEAARASGRGRHGMREHMLRSRESSISHGSDVQPCGSGQGRGRVGRGQCVEARLLARAKGEGHTMFLARHCKFWRRWDDAEWCGNDECVCGGGQWGPPPASLLWSRVRGATGGASPPSPSTARRRRRCRWPLSSSAHPPLASHARLAHAARLGRCPNDRRAGARCFKVCLCLFAATPNPRASVRVRRASPHAGEARAAPQPSHLPPREGGKRAVRRHACACVETDLRNQG